MSTRSPNHKFWRPRIPSDGTKMFSHGTVLTGILTTPYKILSSSISSYFISRTELQYEQL